MLSAARLMSTARYPATLNQQALFTVRELGGPFAASSNVCFQVGYEGSLDPGFLREAFARVARVHDAFRASFHLVDRRLWAELADEVELPCSEHDLRALPDDAQQARVTELIAQDTARPFELVSAPLARVQVVRLGDSRGLLLFAFHHIVVDGASTPCFWRDLNAAYAEVAAGLPDGTAPSSDQMSSVAVAEQAARDDGAWTEALARWREKLSGSPAFPCLELGDHGDGPAHPLGIHTTVELTADQANTVRSLARAARTSAFVVMLAAVKVFLSKVTGVRDGVVYSTFANRRTLPTAVAYLVNTLPLRDQLDGKEGFLAFLNQVNRTVREAKKDADVPGALIAREVLPPASGAPFPLLNVLVNSPPAEYEALARSEHPGLRMWLATAHSPLGAHTVVDIQANTERTAVTLGHLASAAAQPALDRLGETFGAVLAQLLAEVDRPLAEVELMGREAREALLRQSRGPELERAWVPVQQMLASQVSATPDTLAFCGGGLRLSYRELDARLDSASQRLAQNGATAGRFVLIATTGPSAAFAVLAALRLGCPWICVDASAGRARLARAISVCDPAVVLVDAASRPLVESLSTGRRVLIDGEDLLEAEVVRSGPAREPTAPPAPDALAYAILTSGTTGEPKLVAIEHRALSAQLSSLMQAGLFGMTPTMALLAPLTFDAAMEQLLVPLVTGGRVVIPAPGLLTRPTALWQWLLDERVNVLDAVPSLARALLPSAPMQTSLERFILGGEPLAPRLVRELKDRFPGVRIFDTYGPTEATINACFGERAHDEATIGRPLPGTQTFVVDVDLKLLPVGQLGQLAISGPCLARGYLGDPAGTSASFVPSPFEKGERLYLTGDRARWNEAGTLELFGRADAQVKVGGVRVDLHEVERALAESPGVVAALAVRRELAGRAVIVGAYVAEDPAFDEGNLRGALAQKLPQGMVPHAFLRLDALPVLPSGKPDREAITLPAVLARQGPPASAQETIFCELLGAALGKAELPHPDDDFFELGGDSLALIDLLSRATQAGIALSADDVRQHRTARQLAARWPDAQEDALPPTLAQLRAVLGSRLDAFALPAREILLTGATGLLGVHVLDELLQQSAAHLYCLVRAESAAAAYDRLRAAWALAHPGRPLDRARVTVVPGDVAEPGLGLGVESQERLSAVDSVVHCAANVAWAASPQALEEANVEGTRAVAALARKLGARLHYVSTSSVVSASARRLPYVASKAKAEHVVLEAGVPARIWRVGLLAGRLRDGVFPVKAEENGLLLLLSSLLSRTELPIASIELTPVDVCAEFLVRLMVQAPGEEPVVTLYNDNYLRVGKLSALRREVPAPCSRELPLALVSQVLEGHALAEADPALPSTRALLEREGLSWPALGEDYLRRFLMAAAA